MGVDAARRKSRALIVFLRYPEPGTVKTRLAGSVGAEQAMRIYEKLVRRTLGLAADFMQIKNGEVDCFIAFSPPGKKARMQEAYPGPWTFFPQEGSHLGERMERAMLHVMALGYRSVVLTGADLADTEVGDFTDAFDALDHGGMQGGVLGPAADGGFYLIGLNRSCPSVFQPKQWGKGEIYLRTERLLRDAGLQVRKLKTRKDIDRAEDLVFLMSRPSFQSTLSVIVPTVSGPNRLEPFLSSLETNLWPGDEIVVVQADGSREEKAIRKRGILMRWSGAPRGRGIQLNHGARIAGGDIFLFLHDDSMPPVHFAYCVRKICGAPSMSLGCFGLRFTPSTPLMDVIAVGANLRTRCLKLPFGDQGLFCRREVFEKVGGFKRSHLMEDVEFVRECNRRGKLMILPDPVHTSPKRYLERGVLRAFLENQFLMLLYRLGVSDRLLYSFYYREWKGSG